MKKKSLIVATCAALVLVLGLAAGAWAVNADDVSFSGFSATVNGTPADVQVTTSPSGVQTVAVPYTGGAVGTVAPSDSITVTFSVGASGAHTAPPYPRNVGLDAVTHSAPTGGPDITVTGLNGGQLTRSGTSPNFVVSTFQDTATFTAPSGHDGIYTLKITGTDQASSGQKLTPKFFYITFNVLSPSCTPAPTKLEIGTIDCVLLHATSVTLSATLTVKSDDTYTALSGKTITFYVNGGSVGTGVTDDNGLATLVYNPSSLGVGDHSLSADFQAAEDECYQSSTADGSKLGVKYLFLGFQPPISPNTVLTGKCGPVKIKIADANGTIVTDAKPMPCVYFADETPAIVGTDPENATAGLNFDNGNVMRYSDGQYVYNWDLSTVTNGTKTICVDLGEGSCAGQRTVVVSVGKKK